MDIGTKAKAKANSNSNNDNDDDDSERDSEQDDDMCKYVGLAATNACMKVVPTLSILNVSNSKSTVLTVDTDGNLYVCRRNFGKFSYCRWWWKCISI